MRNALLTPLLALMMLAQSGCNIIEGTAAVLAPPKLIEANAA